MRTARVSDSASADDFEPSLLPPSTRLLRRFDVPGRERPYIAYLEERIRRDPRNLRAHVERVRQRVALGDAPGLLAALVDLFIALGPKGRELRGQLLRRCTPLLPELQHRWLAARLDSGLDAADPGGAVPGAYLSRQIAGTTRIVVGGSGSVPTPGELARQASAQGDDAAARELLEEALDFDPGQATLCAELLALYRRGNDRQAFERMRTRMLGRRLALPEEWERAAAWFRDRAAHADGAMT